MSIRTYVSQSDWWGHDSHPCSAIGKPFQPDSTEATSKNFKFKIKQLLEANEMRRFKTKEHVKVDEDDVEFIVRQVWGGRCAVTQERLGCHHPFTLARWHVERPPTPDNIVLILQKELDKIEKEGISRYPVEVLNRVEKRLEWAKAVTDQEMACSLAHPLTQEEQCWFDQWTGQTVDRSANYWSLWTVSCVGIVSFGLGFAVARALRKP